MIIIATVKNLMVRAGMDASGMSKGAKQAQVSMNNLQNNLSKSMAGINKTMSMVKTALLTLGIGKIVKDATQVAVGFESAFGQINRMLGENSNEFKYWAATQGKAYGYSLSEAYKYGSTYANLLSTFTSGTKETSTQTEALMKATAITASMTGRTIDDVGERIRSGLLGNTESIEDLGVNVNVALLETSKAFQQFANGRSWQQLTFQEQQQIRLMSILDQVSTKYGDNLANNTASKQMQFVASLKNVQLALGQAFLPIYNIILPALTSFMNGLATVLGYLAQFMTALFGSKAAQSTGTQTQAIQSQAGAVDDLADSYGGAGAAAKKAQGFLAGFDEVNSVSKADTSGGGSGGSGSVGGGASAPGITTGSGATGMMVEVSKQIQEIADKIKTTFNGIVSFISERWAVISSIIAGAVAGIVAFFIAGKWTMIVGAIANVISYIGLIPTALGLAWLAITSPVSLIALAIGGVTAAVVYLWQTSEEFRDDVMVIVNGIGSVLNNLWNNVLKPLFKFLWDVFVTIFTPIGKFFAVVFVDAVKGTMAILSALWKNILGPIATFIVDIFAMALKGLIEIWKSWKPQIEVLYGAIMWVYENALKPFATFIGGIMISVIENWGSKIQAIIPSVKGVFKGLIDFIVGVFTGNWSKAWQGVVTIFENVFKGLAGLIKGPLNAVISLVNTAIDGINELMSFKIPDFVPKIGGQTVGFNIPNIPYLAKGGITNGPTLAMIGDNPGGQEVVSPLDKLTDLIGGAVGTAVMGAMQFSNSQSGGDIVIKLDGTTLARALNPYSSKESNRIGGSMITVG